MLCLGNGRGPGEIFVKAVHAFYGPWFALIPNKIHCFSPWTFLCTTCSITEEHQTDSGAN